MVQGARWWEEVGGDARLCVRYGTEVGGDAHFRVRSQNGGPRDARLRVRSQNGGSRNGGRVMIHTVGTETLRFFELRDLFA